MPDTTAQDILDFEDRPRVKAKAWGKTFWLRPLTGAERDRYDQQRHAHKDGEGYPLNWRAKYLVRCIEDDAGKRIFSDDQAEGLGKKNGEVLKGLWDKVCDLSLTGPAALETEIKNS